MTIVIHRRAPAVPFVPTELHGELVAAVACCYAGPVDDGEAVVRPLQEFGSPVLDLCRPKPYLEHQSMFDPSYPHGWWYYVRACDVAELTDDVIDVTAEHAQRIESPVGGFPIWQLGGAVARVGDGDTAFNGRGAGHTFNLTATTKTEDGFEDEREWARTFWSALEPYHAGVYVNFLMDEGAGARPPGLRGGEVRPPAGAQAPVRPGQPPPAQPEHPAGLSGDAPRGGLRGPPPPGWPPSPAAGTRRPRARSPSSGSSGCPWWRGRAAW